MSFFLANILLALAWAVVTSSFSFPNFLLGFVIAAFSLFLIREQIGTEGYFSRVRKIMSLVFLFLYELTLSAWRMVIIVTKPNIDVKPGIFAFPLTCDRDFEITTLANLITLTPGTLSVDVSDDRKTLYVHAIDVPDADAMRKDIAEGFERKIMEAFR